MVEFVEKGAPSTTLKSNMNVRTNARSSSMPGPSTEARRRCGGTCRQSAAEAPACSLNSCASKLVLLVSDHETARPNYQVQMGKLAPALVLTVWHNSPPPSALGRLRRLPQTPTLEPQRPLIAVWQHKQDVFIAGVGLFGSALSSQTHKRCIVALWRQAPAHRRHRRPDKRRNRRPARHLVSAASLLSC